MTGKKDRVWLALRSTNAGLLPEPHAESPMAAAHQMEIRVRYQETDGQRRVHHANFLTYFEMGRTEMLRAHGHSYRRFEDEGLFMVVSEAASPTAPRRSTTTCCCSARGWRRSAPPISSTPTR